MDCKEFKQKKQTINAYLKMAKLYHAKILNMEYCISIYGKEYVIITMNYAKVFIIDVTKASCAKMISSVSNFLLDK